MDRKSLIYICFMILFTCILNTCNCINTKANKNLARINSLLTSLETKIFNKEDVKPLPDVRMNHAACNYKNGSFFFHGGEIKGKNEKILGDLQLYYPNPSGRVHSYNRIPTKNVKYLKNHYLFSFDNWIFIYGGVSYSSESNHSIYRLDISEISNQIETDFNPENVFEEDKPEWTEVDVLGEIPRRENTGVFFESKSKRLYIFGGKEEDENELSDQLIYIDFNNEKPKVHYIEAEGDLPNGIINSQLFANEKFLYIYDGYLSADKKQRQIDVLYRLDIENKVFDRLQMKFDTEKTEKKMKDFNNYLRLIGSENSNDSLFGFSSSLGGFIEINPFTQEIKTIQFKFESVDHGAMGVSNTLNNSGFSLVKTNSENIDGDKVKLTSKYLGGCNINTNQCSISTLDFSFTYNSSNQVNNSAVNLLQIKHKKEATKSNQENATPQNVEALQVKSVKTNVKQDSTTVVTTEKKSTDMRTINGERRTISGLKKTGRESMLKESPTMPSTQVTTTTQTTQSTTPQTTQTVEQKPTPPSPTQTQNQPKATDTNALTKNSQPQPQPHQQPKPQPQQQSTSTTSKNYRSGNIIYVETNDCNKGCSNRGHCFNSYCYCDKGFTGDSCEYTIEEKRKSGYLVEQYLTYILIATASCFVITLILMIIFGKAKEKKKF